MKLELDGLKDLLRPLRERSSIEDALRHFALRSGFDFFNYQSANGPHARCLSTYPSQWQSNYRERSYAAVDPVLQQAMRVKAPFIWSSQQLLRHAPRAVVTFLCEARSYGIRSGLSVPVDAAFGRKACLTFASMKEIVPDDLTVDPYTALSAGAFLDSFLDILSMRDASWSVTCPLNQIQLECLTWVAEGKANEDVAILRGVTRRAVEFQLHHIRQRLDVVTTCQAVAVAVRSGWL